EIREIERAPDHELAAVTLFPGLPAVVGTEQRGARAFDERVHDVGIRRRDLHGEPAPGRRRQSFRRLLIELLPARAAVAGDEQSGARDCGRAVATGAE